MDCAEWRLVYATNTGYRRYVEAIKGGGMYLAGEDGCACRFYQKEKTILPRLAPGPPMCRRGVAGERGASEEGLRCKPWECDHSCCGTAGSFVRGFQLDTPSISGLLASSVDSFVGIANLRLLRIYRIRRRLYDG